MQNEEYEDLYELRDTLMIAQFEITGYPSLSSKYGDKYTGIDKIYTQILALSDELDELLSKAISLLDEENEYEIE